MTQYRLAPEVADIAGPLIADHHRDLLDYGYIRIEYVFRDEASTSKGREVWGKARKVGGLNAFLARTETGEITLADPEPFFVIEVAEDIWQCLTHRQRVALVDHELFHLAVDEDAKGGPALSIRGHEVEEFSEVIRRHGLWRDDVARFAKVGADQLSLLDAPGGAFDDETGIAGEAERFLEGDGEG